MENSSRSLSSSNQVILSDWQSEVWADQHRYKVINCGRRAGKSFVTAAQMIHFCSENPNSSVWYVAPTYKQAKLIMWEMLNEFIPSWSIMKKNETELRFFFKNGSQIYLKGADNPDSLRGVQIDFCVFDEVAFVDKWDEVWKVMRPTLMDSRASMWFISTPNGFNHFKELADRTEDGWKYFHYTTYDNPHISHDEIEQTKREMDADSFAQEMMGEFRKMSGLIYKDFDRAVHMVDVPNLDYTYSFTRAIDWGFAHQTALGYFAINHLGTEIYMYDGLYVPKFISEEIASVVSVKDAGKYMNNPVADSESPLMLEELSRRGIIFNPVEKGPDSVKFGIAKVTELLKIRPDTGKPTLMFSKHLSWVAEEFERYRWMQVDKDGYLKDVPLKRDDDAMDMIRYFAMSYKKDVQKVNVLTLPQNMRRNKWKI